MDSLFKKEITYTNNLNTDAYFKYNYDIDHTYKPIFYNEPIHSVHTTFTTNSFYNIKELATSDGNVARALCDTNPQDLSTGCILKLVESMKAKLMCYTQTMPISHFECKMTPKVRRNIIRAWKKLNMYGKQPPFIPRFDEYMNELPEKFNVEGGIIVKMIDPKDYGDLYFELDAILSAKYWDMLSKTIIKTEDVKTYGLVDESSLLRSSYSYIEEFEKPYLEEDLPF